MAIERAMPTPKIKIDSQELTVAIREAKRKKWKVMRGVYQRDALGRLIKVGYFFREECEEGKPPPIKWLRPDECEVEGSISANDAIIAGDISVIYTLPNDPKQRRGTIKGYFRRWPN